MPELVRVLVWRCSQGAGRVLFWVLVRVLFIYIRFCGGDFGGGCWTLPNGPWTLVILSLQKWPRLHLGESPFSW